MKELDDCYQGLPKWMLDQKPKIYLCPIRFGHITINSYRGLAVVKRQGLPHGAIIIGQLK